MKVLMLICDGMADRPIKDFDGKTPLEVSLTENMDSIAFRGICGILDPIAPGKRVGSDTTHLALLGYDPYRYYTGRGPFEALGAGLEVRKGDVAFRVNFATVDSDMRVLDRRAGRIGEGTEELARAVNQITLRGVDFVFKESTGHRGALVFRGDGLGSQVSDSDPHETGMRVMEVRPLDSSRAAAKTARLANEFIRKSHEVLRKHRINAERERKGLRPANMLLLRGCGIATQIPSFQERYGMEGGCMTTTGLIKGIARSVGLDLLDTPEDYRDRISTALKALEDRDFLLLNIKEPDEAAHDMNPERKIELIEAIDEALAPLLDFIEENYMVFLSDHTTSSSYGDHTGDPVPVAIAGPEVRSDDVRVFDERNAAKGGLGRIRGRDIMPIMMDLLNRSEKYGA
jgi:2,3-bisphosphoglycerate-independent phosphoglycerate mutase